MKPLGWRDDRKYPLILSIHGGPHGMYGYAFNPTFQVYAAQGYAVLYFNPRGSNGYGQKFSDGTLNEWGGGDYRDLMAGVDDALKRYAWIDADRLGATGGSYGGPFTHPGRGPKPPLTAPRARGPGAALGRPFSMSAHL